LDEIDIFLEAIDINDKEDIIIIDPIDNEIYHHNSKENNKEGNTKIFNNNLL